MKILLIANSNNDFTEYFKNIDEIETILINPNDYKDGIGDFDSCILLDWPKNKTSVIELIHSGIPAFIRTTPEIGAMRNVEIKSTRFMRLVGTDASSFPDSILDVQDNTHLPSSPSSDAVPLLVFREHIMSHSKFKSENKYFTQSDYALWTEQKIIFCSFDIANFNKARFSPIQLWQDTLRGICKILTGISTPPDFIPSYTNRFHIKGKVNLKDSFDQATSWFHDADILIDEGHNGVYEGFATEIKPDGTQKKAVEIRNDCCSETMFTFFIDHLLNGSVKSKEISDNISDYIFKEMFTNDPGGLLDGMMKWSLNSPNICYQDDVARAIIPQMLKCRYSGDDRYMTECTRALEFLYKTTGTDGLRRNRTENQDLNESEVKRLSSIPANNPSAHYTGYYSGALLLNYTMTGNEKFRDMGVKGLESIMAVYPDTMRCQSETQEYARLLLPLSLMYEATGEKMHLEMLDRVTTDLGRFHHESGTYLEWDTGYQSRYSRTTGDECSILTENGDPVSDLLYTVNWLPFNFIMAYLVTKDDKFLSLWEDISGFMAKSQIISGNKTINGAWARGWDVELNEIFALPNDVGWGPWCIESGWTVAEIASGIGMGLLKDKLLKFYLTRD